MPLIRPMLAVNGEPFDSPDFLYEVKWDGYRCLAYLEDGTVLRSRNLKDLTPAFPELANLHPLVKKRPALLDGEIVAFKNGLPSFAALQARGRINDPLKIRRMAAVNPAIFVAFDVLYLGGASLLAKPLKERKEILAGAVGDGPLVISDFVFEKGKEFFEACRERSLEGMVAKHLASPYLPGKRSRYWRKIRSTKEMDLIIFGYEKGRGERKLGALLLADYFAGAFIYRGKVGTGFSKHEEEFLMELLKPLETKHPPGDFLFRANTKNIHWVKPVLICTVSYLALTEDGLLRQPRYQKMRPDKIPFDENF
ncbi:MAG: non-homologous end-joining DNA ligase [Bacillota bacterium]